MRACNNVFTGNPTKKNIDSAKVVGVNVTLI